MEYFTKPDINEYRTLMIMTLDFLIYSSSDFATGTMDFELPNI